MKKEVSNKILAEPNKVHKVSDFDPDYTGDINKSSAQKLLIENTEKLSSLQSQLYAHDKYALLIIFQAMDAAGKDGTIKHVMTGVNPQGCQVYSFKQPSPEELDHDFLWRVNKCLPERGRIGIFNRSHYEDVLVTKVHPELVLAAKIPDIKQIKDVNEKFWNQRYRQINDFERYLSESGIIVVKFFLNISEEEQEKRFLARLNNSTKNWKFSSSDLKERAHWNDYMRVYSDMLTHTSTAVAPWYVIPANNKWYMRYLVGKIICDKLESLDIHYPTLSAEAKKQIEEYKKILTEDIEKKRGKAPINQTKEKKKVNKTPKKAANKKKALIHAITNYQERYSSLAL